MADCITCKGSGHIPDTFEPSELIPLALQPPRVFNDINIRITLRPEAYNDDEQPLLPALGATISSSQIAVIGSKLKRGSIELSITNGFGRQRTMILSPAELLFLLKQSEKFVEELPQ